MKKIEFLRMNVLFMRKNSKEKDKDKDKDKGI